MLEKIDPSRNNEVSFLVYAADLDNLSTITWPGFESETLRVSPNHTFTLRLVLILPN